MSQGELRDRVRRPVQGLARGLMRGLLRGAVYVALGVLVVVLAQAWAAAVASPAWAEDLKVDPGWEGAPWKPKAQTILNLCAQIGYLCCLLAFLIGGGAMAVGRIVGSYQAGNSGLKWLLGGIGGAIVISSAPALLTWLIK